MTGGFWRKNGVKKGVRIQLTTSFGPVWRLLARIPRLGPAVNRWLINQLVYTMKTRPGALSTKSDWTSWESLHDRTWSQRHLGPDRKFNEGQPDPDVVAELFRRSGAEPESARSALLFPFFAQWFVDGFLRTDPDDVRKNTSTHDIDLSQLYGQTPDVTRILRERNGGRGRLAVEPSLLPAEFPPYLFDRDGKPKKEFANLEILFGKGDLKAAGMSGASEELRNKLFALGIPRGNIHYGFVMMSTLFLREHNRIAGLISADHEDWSDDRVFDTTRNTLIVVLLKIVVEDYIRHITPIKFPLFVEPGIGADQRWYRQNWMSVEFNLLYRWHSLVPSQVTLGGNRQTFADLWWDTRPVTEYGLAALFDEASRQPCSTISLLNTDASMLDIEKKSVEIGRVTQLASYNDYREACGFPRLGCIDDLSSDPRVREAVEGCYPDGIDRVELFVGLFGEDIRKGSMLPPLMSAMVAVDAFSQALTNPLLDPEIFTEDTFSPAGMAVIKSTNSLAQLVVRNTENEGPAPRVSLALQRPWLRRAAALVRR
ncbi:peroxide synthase [Mycobacterium sp. Y57]|uniref:peroxidase family protein n=1 Tax=Mycolicibacterium xanthum TaxID=2796469 RepID=UPI001C85B7F0|nr:peroxidase family protein [Mycolicibacterium xanthum]MBX7434638.1 peroxide synthase [Mycolicibacterium xanthum]